MPSDTYILTISEAGVSVPSSHASTHITGGSDVIPTATSTTSGLMSAAIYNQHVINTAKDSNVTHTGDVTDLGGVLTVKKINGVSLENLSTGILKNTTGTGAPSIAVAADFPTLNQNTSGNAATATLATTATNIAGGSVGSIPYQTGSGATSLLNAGTAGYVLTTNGSSAPSWAPVSLSSGTSGTLPVASGGSGATTFTAGVLTANGTSAFDTITKPSGDLVGTDATQTITNKTFGSGNTFSSPISVASGGTGNSTFTAGILRTTGSTNAFSTITLPSGDVVGTTATQTLTNKTLTSPTLTTPTLGTPTSGTLTNCTGLPLTTGITGTLLVANGGTGVTSSTGSGSNVLSTSPALVTPVLGTPTSGTLTNCTGLPLAAGTTGNLPASRIDGLPTANSAVRGQVFGEYITVTIPEQLTYYPISASGTLNSTVSANMDISGASTFSIKNTSGSTRIFRIYAHVVISSPESTRVSMKLYYGVAGSLAEINESEVYLYNGSSPDIVTLTTSCLVSLANSQEVAIYVNNNTAAENISVSKSLLIAEAVL